MKKRMLAVTMATAMVATTACSGGSKPAETTAAPAAAETTAAASAETTAAETEAEITEPVTIKFANYGVLEAGYDVYWNNLLDEFKKENPNITVELVTAPYGEIMNTVINMAGGGDKVDLMYGEMDWIPTLVEAGLAAPVKDVLSEELLSDVYPNMLNACSIDGEAYGVPMYVSPFLLYYLQLMRKC